MDMLKEFAADDLYITHAVNDHPDNNVFRFHIHDRCELYCFISGAAEYLVEGSVYPMKKGSILIMRPGEAHRVRILREECYERYAVNFPLSVFDSFDPERLLMKPFTDRALGRMNHYSPDIKEEFFSDMFSETLDSYSRKIRIMTSLLTVTDLINREFDHSADEAVSTTVTDEIVGYVNAHLFDRISAEDLAAHFYLSRSQFNRVFRKATGASPWDYITAKRLIAAKEMIRNGSSAGYAASCCGFGDYSCFYRAYVKRFGTSPAEEK